MKPEDGTFSRSTIKLIYVAGPFSAPTREGVEENIRQAVLLGVEVAKLGAMPVVPHANTAHPDYEKVQNYEFWIEGTLELLRRCDAMILHPQWYMSRGAKGEEFEAFHLGLPVFYDLGALSRWLTVGKERGHR